MSEGVTTDFLLDGSEIAEEIAGERVTSYVGPGLISEVSGTARSVYHADGLGSTRAMSGNSQVITEAGIYDAYGNLAQDFPASSSPSFGYAGQHRYYADATGLDYLKARYYDPTVGRFLSQDPIGYAGGLNLYCYTADSPANGVDPEGRLPLWLIPYAAWCTVNPAGCTALIGCIGVGGVSAIAELLRELRNGNGVSGCMVLCKGVTGCILDALGAYIPGMNKGFKYVDPVVRRALQILGGIMGLSIGDELSGDFCCVVCKGLGFDPPCGTCD